MQSRRSGVPRPLPLRLASDSTVSTNQSSLAPSISPYKSSFVGSLTSPASVNMGQRPNSNTSVASGTSAESEAVVKDELDRLGYRYSLRVA